MPEEIPNSTKSFNSCFFDNIKDLCINKARERIYHIIYAYNNKKKNIVLEHSSKILGVSQGLRDIIQTYIENTSNFYLDFYIRPLFKLIL